MSDLSIIAHDYALNAEFARKFNAAVLRLKRLYLVGRKRNDPDPEIEESRVELRQLLTSLVRALSDSGKQWSEEQAKVPVDVIERLRARVKSELPEAISELENTAKELGEGLPLQQKAFATLDRVCEVADATASAAFRRLRRI
jgi:hypothetical protein